MEQDDGAADRGVMGRLKLALQHDRRAGSWAYAVGTDGNISAYRCCRRRRISLSASRWHLASLSSAMFEARLVSDDKENLAMAAH